MSRRYTALARQLTIEAGGTRPAARILGVKPNTFYEHARGEKNANTAHIENAVRKLRLEWRFFTDESLGDDPPFREYVRGAERDARTMVREKVVAWAAKLPSGLVEKRHIDRLSASLPGGVTLSERTIQSWWQDILDEERLGPDDVPPTPLREGARKIADVDAERAAKKRDR